MGNPRGAAPMRAQNGMVQPRYKSRSHYRTRSSASEQSSTEPTANFGATALDRPLVDLSALPPRVAGSSDAQPPAARPPSSVRIHGRQTRVAWFAMTVFIVSALGGVILGAALALGS